MSEPLKSGGLKRALVVFVGFVASPLIVSFSFQS